MGIKPAKIYRVPKKRLFTRKEYMKSIPGSKITIFDMGDAANRDSFELVLSLRAKERAQITHNALEASRIASNRHILKYAGRTGYYLKCKVYPHVVLRENKQASGAGADRVSDGMRRSYGKPVGRGAVVDKGQKLIEIRTTKTFFKAAKDSLRRAAMKYPMPCNITIDKGNELVL